LNLLLEGPLCVCHFQQALREPQVKVSKHLAYLKRAGLVEAQRCANMMIYSLPRKPPPQLKTNLACLQDCAQEEHVFRDDTNRLAKIRTKFGPNIPASIRTPGATCVD
jgi:ArsR family transcriptional regulator